MPQHCSNLDEIAQAVQSHDTARTLNLGNVVCFGMEEVRERLGEVRWRSAETLVRKTMEDAVATILDDHDCYMWARDGSVVIVFGSDDPNVANLKAARISDEVSSVLFGTEEGKMLSFSPLVETREGLTAGEKRDPAEALASLMERSKHVSPLSSELRGTGGPEGQSDRTIAELTDERDRATPGKEMRSSPVRRSRDIHDRLVREFAELQQASVGFGFRPIWDIRNERVAIFESVAFNQDPFGGRILVGAEALELNVSETDQAELDLAVLENGLLEHTRMLRNGGRQILAVGAGYYTLSDQANRRELLGLLNRAPTAIRRTTVLQLYDLPSGVPESRLAELTIGFRENLKTIVARFSIDRLQELQDGLLNRLRSVGTSVVVLDLPAITKETQLKPLEMLVSSARKLGMSVTLSGVAEPRVVKATAAKGVTFFAGPLMGGPFRTLPTAYELLAKDMTKPTAMAMAHAKCAAFNVESWSMVAEAFNIAFATTYVDDEGTPRFEHLAGNVEELCGYLPEELVDAPVSSLQPADMNRKSASAFFKRLNRFGEASVRLKNVKKDGTPYGVLVRAFRPLLETDRPDDRFFAFLEPSPIPGERVASKSPKLRVVGG